MGDVGKKQMPAVIAPKRFQAHQRLVARTTPELAGPFEPALVLPTGGFHRAAALRLAPPARYRVIHSVLVTGQIRQFRRHGLPLLVAQALEPFVSTQVSPVRIP
jgi:hypothetical protein